MLSIVIPTLNEEENIAKLISKIRKEIGQPFEIIVVDDGSTDKTIELLKKLQTRMGRKLRIIRRKKRGLGGAILTGLKAARGNLIVTMDADLSHEPSDINRMLKRIEGYDVIVGSRYLKDARIRNISWKRLLVSKVANFITKRLLGLEPLDLTNNFRIYRRSALEKIPLEKIQNKSFSFLVEILYLLTNAGCKILEFPIIFSERRDGLSKLSKWQYLKFLQTVFRLKFS